MVFSGVVGRDMIIKQQTALSRQGGIFYLSVIGREMGGGRVDSGVHVVESLWRMMKELGMDEHLVVKGVGKRIKGQARLRELSFFVID